MKNRILKIDINNLVVRWSKLLVISLVASMLVQANASAQISIDIGGGQVRGIPIAVVPFKVADGVTLDHDIAGVVAKDLAASGKFEPIDPSRFLSTPSRSEEIRWKDWRFADAEALVIGEVWKIADDNYEVQFRIYDVAREQEMGSGMKIPGLRGADVRIAAHIVSDQVYKAFTGKSGAFNSQIAFVQRTEVEYQRYRYKLLVADWDGYGAREVFASWQPLLSPSWSPDGKKLAFVSFSNKGAVIQILDLPSGKAEIVASFKGVNSAPAWSPDGSQLAYSTSRHGSPDVYVYNLLTKQHQRITSHYGIDTEPAWSPDGNSLLFTSSRTRKPQIYRYDIAADKVSRVTFEGDENANASYSPDGTRLVMVHEGGQIVVLDEETSRVTPLTIAIDESPSFSPNGDMVLYATEQDYKPALMVASSDGRVRTQLEFISGGVREPAWSPLRR